MKPCTSPKKRVFYKLEKKRKKSGEKYQSVLDRYVLVTKKSKMEHMQSWVAKTLVKVNARLKKYGISEQQLQSYCAKKGV
jgi:hypothetical protein